VQAGETLDTLVDRITHGHPDDLSPIVDLPGSPAIALLLHASHPRPAGNMLEQTIDIGMNRSFCNKTARSGAGWAAVPEENPVSKEI